MSLTQKIGQPLAEPEQKPQTLMEALISLRTFLFQHQTSVPHEIPYILYCSVS